MKLLLPRFTCLRPCATTMMPGWYVVRHGGVGAVRRCKLTPGISVIRFSSLAMSEAILVASSARNWRTGFPLRAVICVAFFIVSGIRAASKDNPPTASTPLISPASREIGNKSAGSGYRFGLSRSYRLWQANYSAGEANEQTHTRKKRTGSLGPGTRLHGAELWLRPGDRKERGYQVDPRRIRARRDVLRYGGGLWSLRERGTGRGGGRTVPREGCICHQVRFQGRHTGERTRQQ